MTRPDDAEEERTMADHDGAGPGWVPVRINVFGCPTRIARALGLEGVELPDVDSRDPAYWARVHREGWKPGLRGRVADTEERGDPDWCTLLAFRWGRVRFDLEEGVVVHATAAGLPPALDLVHGLAARGVPLRDRESGAALVKAMQGLFGGGVPDASAAFRAAGLVPEPGRPGTLWWEPDPARWPGA